MPLVTPQDNPKTTDTILFTLVTTDSSGNSINPYLVNTVTIYFLQRGFTVDDTFQLPVTIGGTDQSNYFENALPVAIYGTPDFPAWLSTDTADAFLTKVDFDSQGNPLLGTFSLEWTPDLATAGQGDYVLCYTWTQFPAGTSLSNSLQFFLNGDTSATTSIPTHQTPPAKYITLLDRYTPEMFKMMLGNGDLSPDVIHRTNKSVAAGFTMMENLANQILDLIDANVTQDNLLPYLSNFFDWTLKSNDVALWRRQIKEAVSLYKQKGTFNGLRRALSACGIFIRDYDQLWQCVSSSTWQDGFVITEAFIEGPQIFDLSKIVDLPLDFLNFGVSIRFAGTTDFVQLTTDYVIFNSFLIAGNVCQGASTATWNGDYLSVNPIALQPGDVVLILYKIAQPADQSIEDYIRTLPLADTRDPATVTYPLKNWNVRLISSKDPMFPLVCPERNPFYDPVVFGQVRTEFPYGENAYNMEEYNGSIRDSTNPCDLDKSFLDSCSCCLSSYYNATLEIETLDPDRIAEANEVLSQFTPFHATPYTITYVGTQDDFILPPLEQIETLITIIQYDDVVATQFDFNRLILNGADDSEELKRNMLATSQIVSTQTGSAQNLAVVLFSPGIKFDTFGVNSEAGGNLLEILSGTNMGEYQVAVNDGDKYVIDIVQGVPDTTPFPLDASAFPYRLSNFRYGQSSASIFQDDIYTFSDGTVDFTALNVQPGWSVFISNGPFPGTYPITFVSNNNTFQIAGWLSPVAATGLVYQMLNQSDALVFVSSSGAISVTRQGLVQIDPVTSDFGITQGDYVLFMGTQYQITNIVSGMISDSIFIAGYTSGDVVGVANVNFYQRLIDNGVGYLNLRGLQLTGVVPSVSNIVEDNTALENYLILMLGNYYQIENIVGNTMFLNGPMLDLGLVGTPTLYSIVQFIKTSPITTQDGTQFTLLDRSAGNDSIVVQTEMLPMGFAARILNDDSGSWMNSVFNTEEISIKFEYK